MSFASKINPLKGESYCGDKALYFQNDTATVLVIIDGLGHGRYAEEAASLGEEIIGENIDKMPDEILRICDRELINTRGAAIGISKIENGLLYYSGVGNTRMMIVDEKQNLLYGDYGVVGKGVQKINLLTRELNENDLIIMFTDGLRENIKVVNSFNGKENNIEKLIDNIFWEYRKRTDDVGILIYQLRGCAYE